MRENWQESVYSDGTAQFVSCPQPRMGQDVTISVRFYDDAPIDGVLLWTRQNGALVLREMKETKREKGLVYYSAKVQVQEKRLEYRFFLLGKERTWYYNQRGVTTYMPDQQESFVLLTDYRQPQWVKSAVFYQIFPERFAAGDPANAVRSGEYTYDGHPAIHRDNWEDEPLPYDQGYCLDFHGGDLTGIKEKIPYLKKLGVTCLYLNPIFRAPSTHKYDCIDYFHVDEHFGGDEALAELSRELHANGMKLILDISINHTGTAHRWFNRDGLFFDKSVGAYNNPDSEERGYYFFRDKDTAQPDPESLHPNAIAGEYSNEYKGWWDIPSLPVLNYTSQSLRRVLYEAEDSVLKKWLKPPYEIDGWRFDVADVMARNNEVQLAEQVWPQICENIRSVKGKGTDYILAEDWDECSHMLQGDAWDSPMNYYGCCRPIRGFYGQGDYYYRASHALMARGYKMQAEDIKEQIQSYLSHLPYVMQQNQFNLLNSHDIPRLHNDPSLTEGDVRGAIYLMFMLIGAPSVYYGDEAGIDGWESSIEGCRFPMPWSKDIESTSQYDLYHSLMMLRKEHKAMTEGGQKFLYAKGNVLALARFNEEETIVALCSSSDHEEEVVLRTDLLGCSGISADTDLLGRDICVTQTGKGEVKVKLPAHEALLFMLD